MKLKEINLIVIVSMIIFISYLYPLEAYGQVNTTAIDEAQTTLEPYLETETINVFYLMFLMVLVLLLMMIGFKVRRERWGFVFFVGAFICCVVLSLWLVSPFNFGLVEVETQTHIEEIEWLDGNVTNNYAVNTFQKEIIWLSNENEFRFVLTSLLTLFSLFNALFSILVLTEWFSKK